MYGPYAVGGSCSCTTNVCSRAVEQTQCRASGLQVSLLLFGWSADNKAVLDQQFPHTKVCVCCHVLPGAAAPARHMYCRGRKQAALLYVATYSLSCLTKHSPDYWVLMIGRLLGGIATSLLFSAFESWAVAAHNSSGFEESLLSDLFTKAVFLGNGLMAIASGLIGNVLVEDFKLGPVAPFDAAIVVLLAGGVAIQLTWAENYGNKGTDMVKMLGAQFSQALETIRSGAPSIDFRSARVLCVWCAVHSRR